jgi:aminoglycoside phosphotransferase (APT) family kinase protein
MSVLDQAKPPRAEDQLPVGRICDWLRTEGVDLGDSVQLRQFRGGASNLTYALVAPDRSVVLRKPPPGTKARSAHDMSREVRVLNALSGSLPVPRVLAHCPDPALIGEEFYVMERLEGIILRQDLPRGLSLTPGQCRGLCEAALDTWVQLHQLDPARLGLDTLGRGAGYCRRQIEGWSRRYTKALTPGAASFDKVMQWLHDRIPAPDEDTAACIIHNDYRFDNLVLDPADPTRIIGVLDWEMCTLGDPLMDLGNSLAYWVQADDDAVSMLMRRQPTHLPGMLTRDELVAAYFARSGLAPRPVDFYVVYGIFRLAAILQQIYYRYHHGQTRNPTFAAFGDMARYLEGRCLQRIETAS